GAFKLAMFGESKQPLFDNKTNYEICLKQAYYSEPTQCAGATVTQTLLHDAGHQAKLLEMEMRVLAFGSATLNNCYKFMERFMRTHGRPSFPIPDLRFIQAGLAISEDGKQVFLVEESIRSSLNGEFRKFINNRNVIPTTFTDLDDAMRGRFLAFTQHLQYWLTLKLFFISDYQGTSQLLTDPQVLSSSELGAIFAEGNVSSGYHSLERDHVCNEYCKFFQL
ncbi:hypothetical protein B0H11DRAFT_2301998, partial [Mycena galericulata]